MSTATIERKNETLKKISMDAFYLKGTAEALQELAEHLDVDHRVCAIAQSLAEDAAKLDRALEGLQCEG